MCLLIKYSLSLSLLLLLLRTPVESSALMQRVSHKQYLPNQGPVSRTYRKLLGSEKPFVKLRPAYSVELAFPYVVKRIKIETMAGFVPRGPFVLKIQRELGHPKCARKLSGLSLNGLQIGIR